MVPDDVLSGNEGEVVMSSGVSILAVALSVSMAVLE